MNQACPRCYTENPEAARYCRHCGLVLMPGPGGLLRAGQVKHPSPAEVPDGFEPIENAADLYFRWEATWGGERLLGTEGLAVAVLNAGYPLADVTLRIRGQDESGVSVFAVEHQVEQLPRGEQVRLEIPSYEVTAPASKLTVSLLSAEFGPDT